MRGYMVERVKASAAYILKTEATVRKVAIVFGVGKSTVHKDMAERLERVDESLHRRVRAVLLKNRSVRHIRGGEATRKRYQSMAVERSDLVAPKQESEVRQNTETAHV